MSISSGLGSGPGAGWSNAGSGFISCPASASGSASGIVVVSRALGVSGDDSGEDDGSVEAGIWTAAGSWDRGLARLLGGGSTEIGGKVLGNCLGRVAGSHCSGPWPCCLLGPRDPAVVE